MQATLFVPGGDFRGPTLQVGPHQIAEMANFILGIELGPQVEEVQEGPQAEAHHKMLAVVEGQDAAGMLFRKARIHHVGVALGGGKAKLQVFGSLFWRVEILFALSIAVVTHGSQVEHFLQIRMAIGGANDALARIAH